MKKFRVGVVGAGSIAQYCHIPGYAEAENCELAAIADPEEKCLAMVREKWKFAKEYRCHKDMLANERLDVVSVCTPNKFHAPVAIDCLNAGCDLLLEKPIAMTMEEGEAIKAAARKNGRRVMVGFTHRFNELNRAARAAVESGKIGDPYMIRVRFAHGGPWPGWAKTDWFYNPELAGGGALMDMAVHAFDIIQWYLGPVASVSAKVATLRKDIKVDDNVVAIVEFAKRKCLGYIECGWTSAAGYSGVEIMGDKGVIYADYAKAKTIMIAGVSSPDGKTEMKETVLADGYKTAPWPAEMKYFTQTLGAKDEFSPDIDCGIDTLRLVLSAYESSRAGKRVDLPR